MKLFRLSVIIFVFGLACCADKRRLNNPLIGQWNSLWDKESRNLNINLTLSFDANSTFHVEVTGPAQTEPIRVAGIYEITNDTLTILDKMDQPKQMCSYSDTGRYTFIQHQDTLLFKVLHDRCERRKITFEIGLIKAN